MNPITGSIIKLVIRNPKIMETAVFKKVMFVFPNMIAKRYDKSMVKRQGYELPLNEALSYLDFDENYDCQILDLCTGSGFVSLTLASTYPNAKIIGVDQSLKMLEIAKQKAASENHKNIELLEDDVFNLSFNDGTFDLVTVSNAPFYFDEVVRVLKPTGQFLISVSFGGKSIVENSKRIIEVFSRYNLEVTDIKQVSRGAFILSSVKGKMMH